MSLNGQLNLLTSAVLGVLCSGGDQRCGAGASAWLHSDPASLELELYSSVIRGKLVIEFPVREWSRGPSGWKAARMAVDVML